MVNVLPAARGAPSGGGYAPFPVGYVVENIVTTHSHLLESGSGFRFYEGERDGSGSCSPVMLAGRRRGFRTW